MERAIKIKDLYSRIMDSKFINKLREIYRYLSSKKWISYIVFLYAVAFAMFAFTLFKNSFTLPISGDFTLQQIPFYFNGYDDWWHALTTGEFVMWDDSGMLGVNNIGANAFYYLFNPFYLVLLIVPRSLMPQAQAFMMITKMVLSGVTMKLLLEKFKVKEETTWLFGVSYAFCGWNLYYLWFNHFLEVFVLMPLLLLGIEKIIKDQKPLFLMIVIFVTGLTNYFFLIAFCFCGVIYALFRYFQNLKEYKQQMKEIKVKNNGIVYDVRIQVMVQGIFAFAVGLMLSSIVLFPCFTVAMSTPRAAEAHYLEDFKELFEALKLSIKAGGFKEAFWALWDFLFKWPEVNRSKYLLYPLVAFFTPNVTCYDSVIFNNVYYDNTYASMFLYTPIMLFFIPSIFQSIKNRSVSTLLGLLGIGFLLFTPFAYYCFSGFTSVAYARWYLFVAAISIVFIAIQFDKRQKMPRWYLDISFAIVLIIYGFLIYKGALLVNDSKVTNIQEIDQASYYLYGELIYIVIQYFYLRKNFKKPDLSHDLRYFVAFEAIVMCNITLIGQGTVNYKNLYQGHDNITAEVKLAQQILKEDDDYYRVFSTTCDRDGNNLAMMLGTPGLGTFNSTYNFELEDFLNWSTVTYNGSWSMGIHEKRINLEEFLGVKYYILKSDDINIPFGFTEYMSTDTHTVYINDNFIELGYAFDEVYYSNLLSYSYSYSAENENLYLTGAILDDEDINEIFAVPNNDITIFKTDNHITDISTYYPSSNTILVYRANWDNNGFVGYQEPVPFSSQSTNALTWNSYLDIDLKGRGIASLASKDNRCFVTIDARMGENLQISLYGEDEQGNEYLLTQDKHMTHWYGDKQYDRKYQRGFYIDDELTRVEIRVLDTLSQKQSLVTPYITYQYEDSYKAKIKKLKETPLKNVVKHTNDFSFDTDFDKDKFIVLQIPYDAGWSLETIDEQGNKMQSPKIYKSTGGFLSFLAPKGNYHYKIKYETPYLKQGIQVMSIGLLLVGCYSLGAFYLSTNQRAFQSYYIDDFQRDNYKQKKRKLKEK